MNVLTSAHQLHLELDQAITDELNEIERSGRTDMVHVTGGKRLGLVCGQWRYRLDVAGRVSGLRRGIDAVFVHSLFFRSGTSIALPSRRTSSRPGNASR
jgi:hypothetical protein